MDRIKLIAILGKNKAIDGWCNKKISFFEALDIAQAELLKENYKANGKVEDYMRKLFEVSVEKDKLKQEIEELKSK